MRVTAMTDSMVHRGPDDSGLYQSADGQVTLGSCRLSIRDPSPRGHMPMSNGAGDLSIVYNGEIYNARELRDQLSSEGTRFRSSTDTEVVLLGYEHWGASVVDHLRGIYAFAIHDRRAAGRGPGSLVLARDRLGVKPLYYKADNRSVTFASELRAFRASGVADAEPDPAALAAFLLTGSVPEPLTFEHGVRSLPPATIATIRLDAGIEVNPRTYWEIPTTLVEDITQREAVDGCRRLLRESVHEQLVSDVPLGAFLSGGLDSSAVVALMAEASTGPVRTCSMVFEEEEFSEAHFARAVASQVGSEHIERIVTLDDVRRELPAIISALDQPSVDGVNTYFVSQTAHEAGLTVALSGLGGDEVFGGYANSFEQIPQVLRALTGAARIPGAAPLLSRALSVAPQSDRWGRLGEALGRPPSLAGAYLTRRGLFTSKTVRDLLGEDAWVEARRTYDPVAFVQESTGGDALPQDTFNWISRAELRNYTRNQLLRDTDALSMFHSLEVRVPLLDHRLVEFLVRLPPALKRGNGRMPKPLLVECLQGALPAVVLDRTDKMGFSFPFDPWMRNGLRAQVQELVEAGVTHGTIREKAASAVLEDFYLGKTHWSRPWALAVLGGALAARQ